MTRLRGGEGRAGGRGGEGRKGRGGDPEGRGREGKFVSFRYADITMAPNVTQHDGQYSDGVGNIFYALLVGHLPPHTFA